ncbi:SRPBCC domain-containing protein [Actinoplanes oblitus]|uniref:SRPBCC domain-containing protein n=1 Tax=Actinoplanes oblitus TaxID=3040509 RepID=A0ABY8WBH0_9ACTN|nr:SRPBCC domain-containing protein [Actinoplanes oblitus]WIM93808.1 SRPBCC domain-containing protein [Actinoplanes oblitus]
MTDLVITRVFDAPRELVYRAFVDPDQLAAWFGPVGWSVPRDSIDIDPRPGGRQKFTMVNDADPSMSSPVNATFVEVVENELLVGEEDVRHIPDFGADTLRMRIEFFDEEGGRTRLVLTQSPFPAAMAGGAREGWGSSFTKLDKILG